MFTVNTVKFQELSTATTHKKYTRYILLLIKGYKMSDWLTNYPSYMTDFGHHVTEDKQLTATGDVDCDGGSRGADGEAGVVAWVVGVDGGHPEPGGALTACFLHLPQKIYIMCMGRFYSGF